MCKLFFNFFSKIHVQIEIDVFKIIAIKNAEKNRDFSKFLETLKSLPLSKRQPIGSFLITPVQRVPRYSLLLKVKISQKKITLIFIKLI